MVRGSSVDVPYDNGYEVALNYWFRLPTKRVEFLPTVYYSTASGELDWTQYGVQFKTNIYPFDFGTDCDCPTFGKQGPQLQKGLFLQLAPGVARHQYELPAPGLTISESSVGFTMAGALGLDIGVSNLLTLTPSAGIRYADLGVNPYEYSDNTGMDRGADRSSHLLTTQLGLQLTFRLDKKRY